MRMRDVVADECIDLQDAAGCALGWASETNWYICSYMLKDDVGGCRGKNSGNKLLRRRGSHRRLPRQ